MKHLLTMEQLSEKEILSILDLADQLKYERKHHIEHPLLKYWFDLSKVKYKNKSFL